MNALLQKHGCSNVFTVPEGLRELMADISREVLRAQPDRPIEFISSYLSALLITREHGILAVKILDDLCDCRPTVSENLLEVGIPMEDAEALSQIIKEEIEAHDPESGKDPTKLEDVIQKFWETEKVPEAAKQVSSELERAEQIFKETVSKKDNTFYVDLPLVSPIEELHLGDSFSVALQRFLVIEKKLHQNVLLLEQYKMFIEQYIELGHAKEVDIASYDVYNDAVFFLAHHAVLNEDSKTTKLRVVFDGSMKTKDKISLNDVMLNGPVVQEKLREAEILKKVLKKTTLDEEMTAKVCQVTRNAYRDFWYRKRTLQQHLNVEPDLPWEKAAQHTLEIYKKTKPSFSDLERAAKRIQAAYRGYHIRRNMLQHLKPKKKGRPKEKLPGPPLDIGGERDIDLGPVININVPDREVWYMFDKHAGENLGLKYDPMKTITHVVGHSEEEAKSVGGKSPRKKEGASFVVAHASHAAEEMGFMLPASPTPVPEVQNTSISFSKEADEFIEDQVDTYFKKDDSHFHVAMIPEDILVEYRDTHSDSASGAPSIASSGPGTANVTDADDDDDDDYNVDDEDGE